MPWDNTKKSFVSQKLYDKKIFYFFYFQKFVNNSLNTVKNMSISIEVKDSANITAEKYIAKQNLIPFSLLRKLFRKRLVSVDGKRIKPDFSLEDGQVIILRANLEDSNKQNKPKNQASEETKHLKTILEKHIILNDQHILAFDKPTNIATQGGTKIKTSIDDALKLFSEDEIKPRLVHRLDKETSGVLVTAKNNKTAIILGNKFRNKTIEKTYLAIIIGTPKKKQSVVTLNIENEDNQLQEAVTEYKVIKRLKNNLSLVEFYPVTGRKHQIRITAQSMNTPILGDSKYGNFAINKELDAKELYLHCKKMTFELNNKNYSINAEIPERFLQLIG